MKPIKLYSPHEKQKLLHEFCSSNNPNFFTLVIAGRQSGKSLAAMNQCIYWAIKYPGSVCWFLSHKDALSTKTYREMYLALQKSGLVKSKNKGKGISNLSLTNGSIIEFKSAAAEDSLRGASVDFLVADELSFYNQSTFEEIVLPLLTVKGKKALLITTPKGKNFVYEWFLRSQKPNSGINFLKFTSLDNPKRNDEYLLFLKENMTPELYGQEVLAEWVDSAVCFRNIDKVLCLHKVDEFFNSKLKDNTYLGIDVGLLKDATALCLFNSRGEMFAYDSFTGLEFNEVKERIISFIKKWNPTRIQLELNNQGLPLFQELQRAGISNIDGFNTGNETKSVIINQLISAFSSLQIRCVNDPEIKKQLQGFIFDFSPTGKVRYKAASGFHDDYVMAMALGFDSYLKNRLSGVYTFYTEKDIREKPSTITIGKNLYEKGLGQGLMFDRELNQLGGEDILNFF